MLNIGLDAGVINDRIFVVMVVMALVTTFMTSPIIAWVYPPKWHQRLPPSSSSSALATSSSSAEAAMSKKRTKTAPKTEGFSEEGEVEDEQAEDKHILLFLQNIDSIPLVSNILQAIFLSFFECCWLRIKFIRYFFFFLMYLL